MFKQSLFCSVVSLILAACSSTPDFDISREQTAGSSNPDDASRPTVSHIVRKIECEIYLARQDFVNRNVNGIPEFDRWVGNVLLTLQVDDTAGLTPISSGLPLAFINPLSVSGTSFAFGVNLNLYQTRSRTYSQQYTIYVKDIKKDSCEDRRVAVNLEGDLGLKDNIYMGIHSFSDGEGSRYKVSESKPDSFGGTVSFLVSKGITNLGPLWTLRLFKGPGPGGLGYNRMDTNKIVFTFVPPKTGVQRKATARGGAGASADAAQRAFNSTTNLGILQAIEGLKNSNPR